MFKINDDLSINITRGDIAVFTVNALNEDGEHYLFQKGDVLRIKVTEKKACENVMFQKDFAVEEETEQVELTLTEEDTKIGEVISKPTDYWYEIELNPSINPQTIIGYDEDGAKIFKLFPEGKDLEPVEPTPEEIPVVDEELDLTSQRPVQNQAIARAFLNVQNELVRIEETKNITSEDLEPLQIGVEENKNNIAKNKGSIEDVASDVETLTSTMDANDKNMQGDIDGIVRTIGYVKTKNLLSYPYYETTKTANNITFTDNGDGTISTSGAPSTASSFFCRTRTGSPVLLKAGTYILNGCPTGGSENTHKIMIVKTGDGGDSETICTDYGNGVEFTLTEDTNIGVTVTVFATSTSLTFKPMIRYASIENDVYEPYIADVRTLLKWKELSFTPATNVTPNGNTKFYINENGDFKYTMSVTVAQAVSANAYMGLGTLGIEDFGYAIWQSIPAIICNTDGTPKGSAIISINRNGSVVLIPSVAVTSGWYVRGGNIAHKINTELI